MENSHQYLIDSHCHLHPPFFDKGIEKVAQQALEAGVIKIVNCASDPEAYEFVLNTSNIENVFATLGIQPTYADKIIQAKPLREINRLDKRVVAIGEVGLDYYWIKDHELRRRQEELFIDCIQLANELSLPLVIHSRKAETEVLDILAKHSQVEVLLHSFDGNLKEIEKAKDLGYYISVPTNVTRRRNRRKVAIRAGLETIMIETDSPFCATKDDIERNEPRYIKDAAIYLSTLMETDLNEIYKATTKNAEYFYKI